MQRLALDAEPHTVDLCERVGAEAQKGGLVHAIHFVAKRKN